VDQLLATCEASCYAGQAGVGIQSLKRDAQQCMTRIEKSSGPRPTNCSNAENARYRWTRRSSVAAGAVMLATFFGSTRVLQAGELTSEQSAQILAEATIAYESGRAATEPADAKEAFATAAKKYQTLVDDGLDNGKLYFNLGNAYLQTGDAPRALANYERAAELMPGNRDVERNRAHAAQLLAIVPAGPSGVLDSAKTWVRDLSPSSLVVIAATSWLLLWGALIGQMYSKRTLWRPVAVAACLGFATSMGIIGWQSTQRPTEDRVMVVADSTLVRSGNGSEFAAATERPLTVGQQYEVVERRAEWFRIRLDSGQQGWVSADQVEMLPARG
ncbi:MAG: tetratricopeptide repeat protein, partial [Pirellulales bacterium]|nr:tetratricopeptide repeat protein [Pirellulales bacterium]